jgi:hypothetical protein
VTAIGDPLRREIKMEDVKKKLEAELNRTVERIRHGGAAKSCRP